MSEAQPTTEEAFAAMVSRLLFFDHVARLTGYPGQAILLRMLLLDLAAIHKALKNTGSTAAMIKKHPRRAVQSGDVRLTLRISREASDALDRLCVDQRMYKREVIERLLQGDPSELDTQLRAKYAGLSQPEVEALRALERDAA